MRVFRRATAAIETPALRIEPNCDQRRDVSGWRAQRGCCAGCRHGRQDLGTRHRRCAVHESPRRCVLGKQGAQRSAYSFYGRRPVAGAGCDDRQPGDVVRRQRQGEYQKWLGARSRDAAQRHVQLPEDRSCPTDDRCEIRHVIPMRRSEGEQEGPIPTSYWMESTSAARSLLAQTVNGPSASSSVTATPATSPARYRRAQLPPRPARDEYG